MKIEIVKEWSIALEKVLYRVKVDGYISDSFDKEFLAMEYVDKNRENWKFKPEVVWSEEI